jgi:hypothetical protein
MRNTDKYGYKKDDGSRVEFFAISAGGDRNCVNFPYLASILADLRDQNRKYLVATVVALISIVLAVLSIVISVFR